MATFQAPPVTTYGYQPSAGSHGVRSKGYLYATAAVTAAMTTNDVIQFGYLPINAVVTAVWLAAPTQLDSNVSPTLTFDMGIVGTTTLWKSAISTVGRANSVTSDSTIATTGGLYKNTSGAKVLVEAVCHAAAATAVAGTLVAYVEFFVDDTAGSQA